MIISMYNFIIKCIAHVFIRKSDKRSAFYKRFLKQDKLSKILNAVEQNNKFVLNLANTFYDIRTIHAATGDLRKIQFAGTVLLAGFKKVCEENGINYWLDYGTLLGAVRHKGFIPWDDDIDIGMMRADFEKLKEAVHNYPDYRMTEWLHLKINGIQCRVAKFCFSDTNSHLFLDIFPYDFQDCDDMDLFYDKYIAEKDELRKALANLNMPQYSFCPCTDEVDLQIINETFNTHAQKYLGNTDGNTVLYGMENPYNAARRIFRKQTIFPLETLRFEGNSYSVPHDYEKYLSVNFGDYMKIPPDVGIAKHPKYSQKEMLFIEELLKENGIKPEGNQI